ncbi:response regulator transcription factor [Candidatus Enterococcus ferrettii]|uniref:DNA-binding response regulator n=1 Tax=Candidatus Enterococcus ferrettii TaxID=2815324 RepID=A0ABV0EP38_9ENTE|nr:response regulator transcription factor [Enterococcus sp. 665A]MBO1342899.1 response regulator transcription factor [Enterococcus sp. 665A]
MIKIIIADDQQLIREGLSLVLGLKRDFDIVFEAKNGQEVLDYLETNDGDIVLMDIKMPVLNGVETTRKIKEKSESVKILILTTFDDYDFIFQALKHGADGYLLKNTSSQELIEAIKKIINNEQVLDKEVTRQVLQLTKCDVAKLDSLTKREVGIARKISEGNSNKEIAQELFLSEGTVKNYVSNILSKLRLHNRTEIALFMKKYD